MRLISFRRGDTKGFGLVLPNGVLDLGACLAPKYPTLQSVLSPEGLNEIAKLANSTGDYRLDDLTLCPPIANPAKIICVGLNYRTHLAEAKVDAPRYPIIFLRTAQSQVGHKGNLLKPLESARFDFEGELAVVIGTPGRRIPKANAFDHIAGYTCYNDGSVRDFQRHTSQWGPGKNFPSTGACGPWLATKEDLPSPSDFLLVTRVNGIEMQRASVADLIFSIPSLVEYCSSFAQLERGDLIVTGTPGGVGVARNPPVFLSAGDFVEVEISPIGLLENTVVDEKE